MKPLLLDTGFLLALEIADDQHHEAARSFWRGLVPALPRLITSTYVLDEVATFLNRRNHHAKAVEIGHRLMESPSVDLIHVDPPLFHEAWRYFEQHVDKTYSLTDCASFVLMQRLEITTALTFDRHFRQAGFETLP